MQKRFIIAVDFDGTIVTHKYPDIGELVPYAKQVINMLVNNGNKVFLWTMRYHKKDRDVLDEASQFLKDNNIKIELLNKSPAQFSDSPKQYANIYIDDAAIGIPLVEYKGNIVVDWLAVFNMLVNEGALPSGWLLKLKSEEDLFK